MEEPRSGLVLIHFGCSLRFQNDVVRVGASEASLHAYVVPRLEVIEPRFIITVFLG